MEASSSSIRHPFEWGREAARARPRQDLIDLSLGNPDLEPSPEVREALRRLVAEETPGQHRHMDNAGFEEVRERVAVHVSRSSGVVVGADSVYLTCGAAGALQIVLGAILDPGDEVIVFAPTSPVHRPSSAPRGRRSSCARAGFQLDLAAFEAALTEEPAP